MPAGSGGFQWRRQPMSATLRPMTMTSSAWRVSVVGPLAMALLSCSSNTSPVATPPSPATTTATHAANKEVTGRARAALTEVGAQRLVTKPGYDAEVNTAFGGDWRGHPLVAYVVPTSALPSSSELTVVARHHIGGRSVDVVVAQDSATRMLRFVLGPDTWLLAPRDGRTVSVALVEALLDSRSPRTESSSAPATSAPTTESLPTATPSGKGVRVAIRSHCGVLSLMSQGHLWLADPPLGDHNPPPGWDENVTKGVLLETGSGRAAFEGDGGQRASFRRAPHGAEDPNAGCE